MSIFAGQPIRATDIQDLYQKGTESFSFTTQSSFTINVVFTTAFTSTPTIMTNIDSGSGSTSRWISRAITITTTGFTLFVHSADATTDTWASIPVSWYAVVEP